MVVIRHFLELVLKLVLKAYFLINDFDLKLTLFDTV